MKDIFGMALLEYFRNDSREPLYVLNDYGKKEKMDAGMYFRTYNDMPEIERIALGLCNGLVLEIGAGTGSHALYLQDQNISVHALDISPGVCEIMADRGVELITCSDFFEFNKTGFDTALLLMNGIGICGTIDGFVRFLNHCSTIMKPGGQILFDSSDVSYLYKRRTLPPDHYYGEINFCFEYRRQKGDWFRWLYIDENLVQEIASKHGWKCEIVFKDEDEQFLARLTQ